MHPEVRQDRPGFCPKCGMTPEPVLGVASDEPGAAARMVWTCPAGPAALLAAGVLSGTGQAF